METKQKLEVLTLKHIYIYIKKIQFIVTNNLIISLNNICNNDLSNV